MIRRLPLVIPATPMGDGCRYDTSNHDLSTVYDSNEDSLYAPKQNGKENDSGLNLTDNICDPIILRNILEDICRDVVYNMVY